MNYSHRMRAWATAVQAHRFGGAWEHVPEFAALTEGEKETVRASRSYRKGRDSLGRLDEHGDAAELASRILEGT